VYATKESIEKFARLRAVAGGLAQLFHRREYFVRSRYLRPPAARFSVVVVRPGRA
jgi:hypothetical protein